MKKIFCFLFFYSSLYSQNSGSVTYKVLMPEFEKAKTKGVKVQTLLKSVKDKSEQLVFTLDFNTNQSHFFLNEMMFNDSESDKESTKIASFIIGNTDYYYDIQKNIGTNINELNGTLIKDENPKKNWEISTETKMIDNYLCYKATYTKSYFRDGENKKTIITAWFAPSLPYPFGPIGYNGLPGLILELKEFDRTIYVTNIKIKNEIIELKFPKGKTITEKEYINKTSSHN
jgi:GLPGLI family protein